MRPSQKGTSQKDPSQKDPPQKDPSSQPPSLRPDTVLRPARGARLEWRDDGRMVVHHGAGASSIDGTDRAEAEAVQAAVDGRRTALEVCQHLAPGIPHRRSRRLLRLWFGELLVDSETPPPRHRPRVQSQTAPTDGTALRSVGILGGGSAGHLAALALARALPDTRVTLIESPRHPIVGVGEATTPLMPQFLHADLGLEIDAFWHAVRPTIKLGIQFAWGPKPEHRFPYPFGPVFPQEAASEGHCGDGHCGDGHLGRLSPHALMMGQDRLPHAGNTLALGTDVAYHLDNRRFVAWLQEQSRTAGVERVLAEVVAAPLDARGHVAALVTDDGRRLAYDLYLDCSGFAARLIEGALGVDWVSFEASLFNDRALVGVAPRRDSPVPATEARALHAGWCWNTPERQEDHRGYVFSSHFLDETAAEAELRRLVPDLGELRCLRFASGRRRWFRRANVVALGNAYGFVEPLESTALHLLIRQIGWLLEGLTAEDPATAWPVIETRCAQAWDYLAWFLALHFRFNRALDTPYWQVCRAEADIERHRELVHSFERFGPLTADPLLRHQGFAYPDPLWGPEGIDVLLLGQRVPHRAAHPPTPQALDRWRRNAQTWQRAVDGIPNQQQWLAELDRSATARHALVAPFLARGPAFLRHAPPRPATVFAGSTG